MRWKANDQPSSENGSAPGWYPDPKGRPGLRWWDGEHWTANIRPDPPGDSSSPPAALSERKATMSLALGIVGLLASFFHPVGLLLAIAGAIIGVVALRECNRGVAGGRATAIAGIVTGVLVSIIYAVLIALYLTTDSPVS